MKAQNYVRGDFGLATRKPLTRGHAIWLGVAFVVPGVLGIWATTQWFAWTFSYAPALGPALDGAHAYAPWRIFTWLHAMHGQALPELGKARGFLALSGVASVLSWLVALSSIMRELRNRADEAHDSGRWGREDELREHGLLVTGYPQDGIVLGTYQPDPNRPPRKGAHVQRVVDNTDTPVAVVGPPGAGKNTVIGFPTLLAWRDSAFVIDPKLESYRFTAGYRAKNLNQWVGILDFLNSGHSFAYNFLDFIRLGTDYEVRDAGTTALYFTDSSGRGTEDARNEHWVVTPAGLLAAACLHVMYRARREKWGRNATMFDVAWELSGRDHPAVEAAIQRAVQLLVETKKPVPEDPSILVDATVEVIRSWISYEHAPNDAEAWERPNGTKTRTHLFVSMRAQEQLDRMSTPEGSGHVSTVRKVLTLFEDPQTRRVTSRSDFRVEDLQALRVESPEGPKEGLTLYVPFSLADARLKPLYRAFICQATSRLTETQRPKHERRRLLYFLDEFPTLGRLDVLFNIFGVGRGYGIKPVVFFQTFAQLEERWGAAAARALIDTAETLVAMAPAPGAIETAERLSKMTGRVTIRAEHRSRSAQGGRTNVSDSQRESSRALLTAVEIMSLPRTIHKRDRDGQDVVREDGTVALTALGHQLMFRKNLPVVRLLQSPHYADPVYLRLTRIRPPARPAVAKPQRPDLAPLTASLIAQSSFVPAEQPHPSHGWTRPGADILGPSRPTEAEENTTELLELLEGALQAHGLQEASLARPLVGPRLITFEIGATEEVLAGLHAVAPDLAAALSRGVVFRSHPAPHLAVPRLHPMVITAQDLPEATGLSLPLGLDTDGAAVEIDLGAHALVVPREATPRLVCWLAPLVLTRTPDELSFAVACDGIDLPWPHAQRREPVDLLAELDQKPQPATARIVIADDSLDPATLDRLRSAPHCGIILLRSEQSFDPPGGALVRLDNGLAAGDIWLDSPGQLPQLVHTLAIDAERLAALETHWRSQVGVRPMPLLSDDGTVDSEALLLDLHDVDQGDVG